MAYYLDWLDKTRNILKVQLLDPLSISEVESLLSELNDLTVSDRPLYILADIRDFNWQDSPLLDDTSLDLPQGQLKNLVLALVGGGPFFKLLNRLVNLPLSPPGTQDGPKFRTFQYEDRAYAWLSALADGLPT